MRTRGTPAAQRFARSLKGKPVQAAAERQQRALGAFLPSGLAATGSRDLPEGGAPARPWGRGQARADGDDRQLLRLRFGVRGRHCTIPPVPPAPA